VRGRRLTSADKEDSGELMCLVPVRAERGKRYRSAAAPAATGAVSTRGKERNESYRSTMDANQKGSRAACCSRRRFVFYLARQ
jgi:hypothetical protein